MIPSLSDVAPAETSARYASTAVSSAPRAPSGRSLTRFGGLRPLDGPEHGEETGCRLRVPDDDDATTTDDGTATETTSPGFGAVASVLGLLGSVLLARRD